MRKLPERAALIAFYPIDYDTNSGYLYRIQFNGTTVWQLTTMDEYLRTRQATIGATSASWTYDSSKNMLSQIAATGVQQYDYSFNVDDGNLTWRKNYLKDKTQTFEYDTDKLDRLTKVTGPVNLLVGYTTNKNGNIQTKGDAGTYVYDTTQPYAVDQVTNGQNISATQQDITYYSFEKVKSITEGTKTAGFVYNAEQQRIRMILKTSGTATKTRWYFGSSCERELVAGVTTQYIWIGGDAYTAVAVAKKVSTGSWTVYNIFRDHLGTITHLKNGSTIDEYSFDAWGRRRNATDWTYTLDANDKALFADRGFTAHEYLEDFKLYNMNGRLYDPVVGRFLNADPVIQDAGFTQNYNRYSYCLNNPLKYTDPTGNQIYNYGVMESITGLLTNTGRGGGGGSNTPHIDSWYADGSMPGSYSYNDYTGKYTDYFGNGVPFNDVFNNYINPNGTAYRYGIVGGDGVGGGPWGDNYGNMVYRYGWYDASGWSNNSKTSLPVSAGGGFDKFNNYIGLTGMGMGALSYAAKNSAAYTPRYAYRGMAQAEAAAARLLGKIARITKYAGTTASVLTTIYSGNKVLNQIQTGGLQNINGWDATDTGVGLIGIGATGAVYFGIISNPVGWTIGAGVLIYGGVRLTYDLYNEE